MKKLLYYTNKTLPKGPQNLDLLDFLLQPDYLTKDGRRVKIMGTTEKIKKYWRHITGEDWKPDGYFA